MLNRFLWCPTIHDEAIRMERLQLLLNRAIEDSSRLILIYVVETIFHIITKYWIKTFFLEKNWKFCRSWRQSLLQTISHAYITLNNHTRYEYSDTLQWFRFFLLWREAESKKLHIFTKKYLISTTHFLFLKNISLRIQISTSFLCRNK